MRKDRPPTAFAIVALLVGITTACSNAASPTATTAGQPAATAIAATPTGAARSASPGPPATPTRAGTPATPAAPVASPSAPGSPAAAQPAGDWVRFGFDPARSGVNPGETRITPATVGGLHRLWRVMLPGVADSSPVLLHALPFPDGATRDVLYATTRDGRLLALDAASGALLWAKQPSGPKITHSSPVADPARRIVYAYGLDGALHRYAAVTGEELAGGGWPVQVTQLRQTEKESSALNIVEGRVYVTTSGYFGDAPPYQGHVLVVDPDSGAAQVFNSLCSDVHHLLADKECRSNRSGIWARGGTIVDPATGNLFVATGNGPYDADRGGADYGDSVLELSPDGARLLDSYTPATYQELDDTDGDLGSTAPALLPPISGSKTPLLAVQGGKDRQLRLLNRQDLSGRGGPGHVGGGLQAIESAGCATFAQPVVWTDPDGAVWVIVAGTCGIDAYRAVTDGAGATRLQPAWKSPAAATTPVIAGGVLFAATSGAVLALDPRTGRQLWSSAQPGAGGTIGGIHWESPIVIGGVLYVAAEGGALAAYGP